MNECECQPCRQWKITLTGSQVANGASEKKTRRDLEVLAIRLGYPTYNHFGREESHRKLLPCMDCNTLRYRIVL